MSQQPEGDAATNHGVLDRILALVPALLSGVRSRSDLLARMPRQGHADGLSTLNRDMRLLRRLGFIDAGNLKSAPARPGPALPLWTTPDEARALAVAWHLTSQLDLPEAGLLRDLLLRLPAGPSESSALGRTFPPPPGQVQDGIWRDLLAALEDRRQLGLIYLAPGRNEPDTVLLDHAELRWMTGALYLVGLKVQAISGIADYRALREYRLDRIQQVLPQTEVCIHDRLPLLRVVFQVDGAMRDRLVTLQTLEGECLQNVTPRADGSLIVETWETGLIRARQRIFALGPHVRRVIEPPELLPVLHEALNGLLGTVADVPPSPDLS